MFLVNKVSKAEKIWWKRMQGHKHCASRSCKSDPITKVDLICFDP